jgi:hypothetical protein
MLFAFIFFQALVKAVNKLQQCVSIWLFEDILKSINEEIKFITLYIAALTRRMFQTTMEQKKTLKTGNSTERMRWAEPIKSKYWIDKETKLAGLLNSQLSWHLPEL